jgi:hypothetical protein
MRAASRPFALTSYEPAEHELQIDCTKMLRVILLPEVCWTAIDHAHSLNMAIGRNGRPIGLMEAAKRKARGIKAGITDYLFWANGDAFAIELKATVDGVLSDDQKDWLRAMIGAGASVSVCWTIDQVFQKVVEWGLVRASARLMAR